MNQSMDLDKIMEEAIEKAEKLFEGRKINMEARAEARVEELKF